MKISFSIALIILTLFYVNNLTYNESQIEENTLETSLVTTQTQDVTAKGTLRAKKNKHVSSTTYTGHLNKPYSYPLFRINLYILFQQIKIPTSFFIYPTF